MTGFWRGRRVLVTGHTGFKGAWLCTWLHRRGAALCGIALPPEGSANLSVLAGVERIVQSHMIDIRDGAQVQSAFAAFAPEVVFHLAAQSLVRRSYRAPVETFATNVMGTVNVLQAVLAAGAVKAVLVVTSDKCYVNRESPLPYREEDTLGGADPYSASKACAELATASWRSSFFTGPTAAAVATARAGNVIGGGDWSQDRLVPDCIAAWRAGRPAEIRNPSSTRPWQHVLDPLHGYMMLAERLCTDPARFAQAWNFGPSPEDVWPVSRVADLMTEHWGHGAHWLAVPRSGVHEAGLLAVDATLARTRLEWAPRLPLPQALAWTVDWYRRFYDGAAADALMHRQIGAYEALAQVPA